QLTSKDIELLNPNTRTCPIFRTGREVEITRVIYHRIPILVREGAGNDMNPWQLSFQSVFHMANDSHLFQSEAQLRSAGLVLVGNRFVSDSGDPYVPLYEAKMATHFDHRFGTYAGRAETSLSTHLASPLPSEYANPEYAAIPRYWIRSREAPEARWA